MRTLGLLDLPRAARSPRNRRARTNLLSGSQTQPGRSGSVGSRAALLYVPANGLVDLLHIAAQPIEAAREPMHDASEILHHFLFRGQALIVRHEDGDPCALQSTLGLRTQPVDPGALTQRFPCGPNGVPRRTFWRHAKDAGREGARGTGVASAKTASGSAAVEPEPARRRGLARNAVRSRAQLLKPAAELVSHLSPCERNVL